MNCPADPHAHWRNTWLISVLSCVASWPVLAHQVPGTAAAAVAPTCAAAPSTPRRAPIYLLPSQVDIVALLPPPPLPDSAAQREDLQAVLQAQRAARRDGTVEHALADVQSNCGRFADAVGDALETPQDAGVLEFLNRAAREGSAIAGPAKGYWKRTRPYAFSREVEALGDMSPEWKLKPEIDTPARAVPSVAAGCAPIDPAEVQAQARRAADELAHSSYPSGHSTFGTVCSLLLTDMVPERREQLYARSVDFGHSRLVMGAHFPSDIQSGRIVGTLAVQLLMQDARFQRDFAQARATLRASLGLPAELPVLESAGP